MSDLKKLRINKETLRTLSHQEAGMVAGQTTYTGYGFCQRDPTAFCTAISDRQRAPDRVNQ